MKATYIHTKRRHWGVTDMGIFPCRKEAHGKSLKNRSKSTHYTETHAVSSHPTVLLTKEIDVLNPVYNFFSMDCYNSFVCKLSVNECNLTAWNQFSQSLLPSHLPIRKVLSMDWILFPCIVPMKVIFHKMKVLYFTVFTGLFLA